MDVVGLIAYAPNHHVEQFEVFVEGQRWYCTKAHPAKLRLGENNAIFERLYCVDFIKNDEKNEILEPQPDRILSFPPVSAIFGATAVLY